MEFLLKRGYFDGDGNPFERGELGFKEANGIRTACLNFSRDRYSLIRQLSRKDIQVVVGSGCPSIDRKVVNSGKRLRAHVGIDEGNVCSSCNLRGSCERAYVKAKEYEVSRTADVMRILLTYGLDTVTATVENKQCLNKVVKESVRRLLNQMVEFSIKEFDSDLPNSTKRNATMQDHLSLQEKGHVNVPPMKQGNWRFPKCNFLNFAGNIRCLRYDGLFQERLSLLKVDQEHLPLKSGDWICDKCNFFNFAKNTKCLQCKEKPSKRQLNPGEWECESCNFINFRKNMVCLKCNHRRPKASNASSPLADPKHGNGDYHTCSRRRSVSGENIANDHKYVGRRSKHGDLWRFVESEGEDQDSSESWDEVSGLANFPVEGGGKSKLSLNGPMKKGWRLEMLERSRGAEKAEERDSELRSVARQWKEFLESTDDEEMADWF
ncbi:zf-RanBP domain-containing protein, partial [Cephalotus follicularis]